MVATQWFQHPCPLKNFWDWLHLQGTCIIIPTQKGKTTSAVCWFIVFSLQVGVSSGYRKLWRGYLALPGNLRQESCVLHLFLESVIAVSMSYNFRNGKHFRNIHDLQVSTLNFEAQQFNPWAATRLGRREQLAHPERTASQFARLSEESWIRKRHFESAHFYTHCDMWSNFVLDTKT